MARARRKAAEERGDASPARGVRYRTISASLPAPLASRVSEVAQSTYWAQSRVVANALDLYTRFSLSTVQRMTELEESLGASAFREAVVRAVEREVDRLEWEAAAAATSRELEGRLPAAMREEELVTHARAAIAESRAARRARR